MALTAISELARQVFSPEEIKVIEEGIAASLNKIIKERLLLNTRLSGDFGDANVYCKSLTTNLIKGEGVKVDCDSFIVSGNLAVTKNNVRISVMDLKHGKEITLLALDGQNNIKKIKIDAETFFGDNSLT